MQKKNYNKWICKFHILSFLILLTACNIGKDAISEAVVTNNANKPASTMAQASVAILPVDSKKDQSHTEVPLSLEEAKTKLTESKFHLHEIKQRWGAAAATNTDLIEALTKIKKAREAYNKALKALKSDPRTAAEILADEEDENSEQTELDKVKADKIAEDADYNGGTLNGVLVPDSLIQALSDNRPNEYDRAKNSLIEAKSELGGIKRSSLPDSSQLIDALDRVNSARERYNKVLKALPLDSRTAAEVLADERDERSEQVEFELAKNRQTEAELTMARESLAPVKTKLTAAKAHLDEIKRWWGAAKATNADLIEALTKIKKAREAYNKALKALNSDSRTEAEVLTDQQDEASELAELYKAKTAKINNENRNYAQARELLSCAQADAHYQELKNNPSATTADRRNAKREYGRLWRDTSDLRDAVWRSGKSVKDYIQEWGKLSETENSFIENTKTNTIL